MTRLTLCSRQAAAVVLITLMSIAGAALEAATLPADSKVLFVGSNASGYEACFAGIYAGDASVNGLNITTASLTVTDVLGEFYANRSSADIKNTLMTTLDQGYDVIVFIDTEAHQQSQPEIHMETVRVLRAYTRELGSEIVVPMLWDASNAVANTATFEEHAYRIADAYGLACVPAGLTWQAVLNDGSFTVQESSPASPNTAAEFAFASTLYAHFFEQSASGTSYDHGLTADRVSAIIDHAYAEWFAAQSATHYTGAYTSSSCRLWTVPHDMDEDAWAAMGSSTERDTHYELETILTRAGHTKKGDHLDPGSSSGYNRYFDGNLASPDIQSLVTSRDYNFAYGRTSGQAGSYPGKMDNFHSYDPNGDAKFIAFYRHTSYNPVATVSNVSARTATTVDIGRSDPDVWGIPNYIGIARAWHERPELIVVREDNEHMSELGTYLQAAMLWTVVTGGQSPVVNAADWDDEQLYILHMSHKTVVELAGLTTVVSVPIAYNGLATAAADVPVDITVDGIDLDALPLSLASATAENGSISSSGLTLTYTSNPGFSGTDTISFRLTNGTYESQDATVTVQVVAPLEATASATPTSGTAPLDVDLLGSASGGYGVEGTPATPELLHWEFEDGSGSVAADTSGAGNDGTVTGATWGAGYTGGGLVFSGAAGEEVLDDDAELFLNDLGAITVALWIKSNAVNTDAGFLICEDPDGGDDSIAMRYDSAGGSGGGDDVIKVGISTTGEGTIQVESAANVQVTEWQHVAMTWSDGNPITLYIDGVETVPTYQSPVGTGTIKNVTKLLVGRGGKDASSSWNGAIDDLRIFNRELSANEVAVLYHGGSTYSYSWDFDASDGIQEDATGANVSHMFTEDGEYTVTLTVSDGVSTTTDTVVITIGGATRTVSIGVDVAGVIWTSDPIAPQEEIVGESTVFSGLDAAADVTLTPTSPADG